MDKDSTPSDPIAICRCIDDPRPHVHVTCEIDRFVKAHVLGGALLLVAAQHRRHWGKSCVSSRLAFRLTALYDKVIPSKET